MDHVSGLQHIGIPCRDLQEAVRFYRRLGFSVKGSFAIPRNAALQNICFLEYGNLVLELYDTEPVAEVDGAINHLALNVMDKIEDVYALCLSWGLHILTNGIEVLPFWEHGIRYFIIEGPNRERIEFCRILEATQPIGS